MDRQPLIFFALVVAACSGGEVNQLVVGDGCQPLTARNRALTADEAELCLGPYPSDFYRNGGRVALTGQARFVKASGEIVDPNDAFPSDGFSTVGTIVASLGPAVDKGGLPSPLHPEVSTTPASVTILLDPETGELIAHYTDVYDRVPDGASEPIAIRPLAPLKEKHRYVVAIAGMKGAIPQEGFRRLRDRIEDIGLARYENDVFAPLAKAGIERARLDLAWDFTTGSTQQVTHDMLRVRELTLAWLQSNTPTVSVGAPVPASDRLSKILKGTITGPLFLTAAVPGAQLARGPDGEVIQTGNATFPFEATISASLEAKTTPGRVIALGHGFFGGPEDLEGNGERGIADALSAVMVSIPWWGMSKEDFGVVGDTLTQRTEHVTEAFTDRVHQAMANWLVTTAAIKGPMASLRAFQRESGDLYYDPSFVGYFGASQGHILGGTLAALDPDFSRVVLNVGGAAFTQMMPRSQDFGAFALLAGSVFTNPVVLQAFLAMLQRPLDRIDPATYAPLVMAAPLPGSPPDRSVLVQTGLGDPAVPNACAFLHARALGLKQMAGATYDVFGLAKTSGGDATPTIELYDFGIDLTGEAEPFPLNPNQVHTGLRADPAAVRQMDAFLRPGGLAVHTCDGPCDPE